MKAWVVTVDAGYGHQRAAYPFAHIAYERIITANSDRIISQKEKVLWHRMQSFYESISRFRSTPLIGKLLFDVYDNFQKIAPLHPYRDLSFPNVGSRYFHRLIEKGLGKSFALYVKKKSIPFLTTYFGTALSAEYHGIKPVYCVVTDTDINRVWVQKNPKKSTIQYLVPLQRTASRLESYGVSPSNITVTGFPLPQELTKQRDTLLANRLLNLDPQKKYISTLKVKKGKKTHILTVTYVVGGAGAQVNIGIKLIRSFKKDILLGKVKLILVAGTHLDVAQCFKEYVVKEGIICENMKIQVALSKLEYFTAFSQILETTDILWTKPSELSFYTALGIPLICSDPVGAHEEYNLRWLQQLGSGFVMDDPLFAHEWLFDWLYRGVFAKAAFDGYMFAPHDGTEQIISQVFQTFKK